MFYIKCALCDKTQDLENTDINEANKEVIQRGWFNKVINDRYTAICPDCLCKIVQKEYASSLDIDLEKEIELEWRKCNPIDDGMGCEFAYISIEQFYSILHRFFNMGSKVLKI